MIAFVLAASLAQAPQVSEWTHLPDKWAARLVSAGGELEFGLTLGVDGAGGATAQITNASETIEVPLVQWSRETLELVLEFPHYDSRITAKASSDGAVLRGTWRKRKGVSSWTEMGFEAQRGASRDSAYWPADGFFGRSRLRDELGGNGSLKGGFFGRWSARFASASDPCVALFEGAPWGAEDDEYPGGFSGTFLTNLGDYRYLAGALDPESNGITLSCFDGAHAFLFKATLQDDGSLSGDFWSGDSWHDTWTAVRDENAKLPDPFGLTKSREGVKLDELAFPDLGGAPRKLGDPAFAGKARIVQLFGTWCPNCNDEARYLAELDRLYRVRGLSIVGLAFELTGDFERDAAQVKRYSERHELRFPLLVAGVSDKKKASERFPLLDQVRAFPTTLFVDASGRVRAVHQGFSGPATGAEHVKLREDFERLIESLLAEAK
jgi:thiol-disulfide isomerase/thioredoxin